MFDFAGTKYLLKYNVTIRIDKKHILNSDKDTVQTRIQLDTNQVNNRCKGYVTGITSIFFYVFFCEALWIGNLFNGSFMHITLFFIPLRGKYGQI